MRYVVSLFLVVGIVLWYLYSLPPYEAPFDITGKKIKLVASGSAQPNISSKDIESIKTINPPTELLKIFNNLVSPIFSKILLNLKENKNLIEVKNILIKDLVNGKLKINNLKKKKIEN